MGQGGRTARPIWDIYMRKIYDDESLGYEKARFDRPLRGVDVTLDCNEYTISPIDSTLVEEEPAWDPNSIDN